MPYRLWRLCALLAALALSPALAAAAADTSPPSGAAVPPAMDGADARPPLPHSPMRLAQASCAASINSCRNINSTQRCHATERVIYTKSGSLWCKTPATCTC
jgi:hypothetical protein